MEPVARVKPEAELPAGLTVGEYVVETKIGEGGFGSVFRASHPKIGKLAAIKVLSRKYSGDPEIVSRFTAEARAVNQIRHRNIIDIFAFGELDDGRHYYVMELLEGEPLDKILDDAGAMALGEALPILRGIARALDAAHEKGIAHRDLKPENVFLARDSDGNPHPKLLDFGIAKLIGEEGAMHRTRTGAPIGTPYYMSPEQCRGQSVDHRTDIYSFGCVAYQLLTGELPFVGTNHLEVLMKQTTEEPVPPSQRARANPALPPLPTAVDDAIAWMMRKDPTERPPNLLSAMRALEEAAGVEYVSDVPLSRRTPSALTPIPPRRAASVPPVRDSATALAHTMAVTGEQAAPAKRRAWWLIGAGLVVAIGGGVAALTFMKDKPSAPVVEPAMTPEAATMPTPAPAAAAPAPAVAPVEAAPPEPALEVVEPAPVAPKSKPVAKPRPKVEKPKPAEPTKPAFDPYARH
jgi:eukaryotic-like serine/threonine-protein kinase